MKVTLHLEECSPDQYAAMCSVWETLKQADAAGKPSLVQVCVVQDAGKMPNERAVLINLADRMWKAYEAGLAKVEDVAKEEVATQFVVDGEVCTSVAEVEAAIDRSVAPAPTPKSVPKPERLVLVDGESVSFHEALKLCGGVSDSSMRAVLSPSGQKRTFGRCGGRRVQWAPEQVEGAAPRSRPDGVMPVREQ